MLRRQASNHAHNNSEYCSQPVATRTPSPAGDAAVFNMPSFGHFASPFPRNLLKGYPYVGVDAANRGVAQHLGVGAKHAKGLFSLHLAMPHPQAAR